MECWANKIIVALLWDPEKLKKRKIEDGCLDVNAGDGVLEPQEVCWEQAACVVTAWGQ